MQRFSEVPEEAIEKMRFSYGRNVAVSAPREIENLSHQAASMHLCYSFKPSSFMLGMPNEQPKLRVANSRRTRRCRPPTALRSARKLAPLRGFRRRVSNRYA